MTTIIKKYLPVLFLIIAFLFLMLQHASKPRILILQSYEKNNERVIAFSRGIERILKKREYLSLRWYYMNTKQLHDVELLEKAAINVENIIGRWHPDIIIAIDTNAQELVARYYLNDPNIKLVFGGIGSAYKEYGYDDANNVTGVFAALPFAAAREIYASIFKNKHRLYFLTDGSISSKNRMREVIHFNWSPFILVKARSVISYAEWQQALAEANQSSDLLFIGSYHAVDTEQHDVTPQQVLQWTLQHTKIPIVGMYANFVRDGGGLAVGVDEEEHGAAIAALALKIVENKFSTTNIPIIKDVNFIPYLRESELRREFPQVDIPPIVLAFAKSAHAYY